MSMIRKMVLVSFAFGFIVACSKDKDKSAGPAAPVAPQLQNALAQQPSGPLPPQAGTVVLRSQALREAEERAANEHGSGTGNAVEGTRISPLDSSIIMDALVARNYVGTADSQCVADDSQSDLVQDGALQIFSIRCGGQMSFAGAPNGMQPSLQAGSWGQLRPPTATAPVAPAPSSANALDLTLDQHTRFEFVFDNT